MAALSPKRSIGDTVKKKKNVLQIKCEMSRIPTGRKITSWSYLHNAVVELNLRLPSSLLLRRALDWAISLLGGMVSFPSAATSVKNETTKKHVTSAA